MKDQAKNSSLSLWTFTAVSGITGAGVSTVSNQQHLIQKKLTQVQKNDVTVTLYLSVLEGLWQ